MSKKPLVISYLRYSSPEQASGDSVKRQTAAAERWASSRGLVIDDALRDPGVSAFRKKHLAPQAALGSLLTRIDAGEIPRGSILLVESLDRLSRDEVFDALELFKRILKAGVKIVTLMDQKEYDWATVSRSPGDLILSILIFARANEESATKGERVHAAWRQKQLNAATEPLGSHCPQWIRWTGKRYELITDAVKPLRKAVDMALGGYTWREVLAYLNKHHPKTTGRTREWTKSGLLTLLCRRTLIGEYQPKVRENGAHPKAIGEPLADYYPAAIDPQKFRKLQALLRSRRNTGGSRAAELVNIWSGRLYDPSGRKIYAGETSGGRRYASGVSTGVATQPRVPLFATDRGLLMGLAEHLRQKPVAVESTDARVVDRELEALESRLEALTATLSSMTTDPAVVVAAIDGLQARRDDLRQKRDSMEIVPTRISMVAEASLVTGDLESDAARRRLRVLLGSVVEKIVLTTSRTYRDFLVESVIHLRDGSQRRWTFRLEYREAGRYAVEIAMPQ